MFGALFRAIVRTNWIAWGRGVWAALTGKSLAEVAKVVRATTPGIHPSTARAIARRAMAAVELGMAFNRIPAHARIDPGGIPSIRGLYGRYQGQQSIGIHYAVDVAFKDNLGNIHHKHLIVVTDDAVTRAELRQKAKEMLKQAQAHNLPGSLVQAGNQWQWAGMTVRSIVRVVP